MLRVDAPTWGLQFKPYQSKKPIKIPTIFIPKKGDINGKQRV
jgi:hypothetical protein